MWLLCSLWAQEPENIPIEDPSNSPSEVSEEIVSQARLPVLENTFPVVYPERALDEGFGGEILFELIISAEGEILDIAIEQSLREDMDEAASTAIQQYTFSPALDENGAPVSSVITYRFVFEPTAVPAISVEGFVFEAGVREPLSNIKVVAFQDQEKVEADTDTTGRFRFRGLASGPWTIMASAPALEARTADIRIEEGKVSEVKLYLIRDEALSKELTDMEIVVEDRVETAEVTERFLSADDISYLPGSGGDIVKAIQNLPGIARPPFGLGQLIIRGTAPENSRYYLDGVMIPNVFHFGGITTVISSSSIEEVAYIPGNYSVRYGRQYAGLVDLRTKMQLPEKNIGKVSVDILQSELFIQHKINDEMAISISGRRSYADIVLNPVVNGFTEGFNVRLPRYYDAQLRWLYTPTENEKMDVTFLLSDDRFSFLGEDAEDNEASLSFRQYFQKIRLRWEQSDGQSRRQETTIIAGPERTDFDVGTEIDVYQQLASIQLRHEHSLTPSDGQPWGMRVGVDILSGEDSSLFKIPDLINQRDRYPFIAPGIYGEVTRDLEQLRVVAGLRGDAHIQNGDIFVGALDPRVSFRYNLTDDTTINGGLGIFSQFPETSELEPESGGNDELLVERSFQYAVGLQHRFTQDFRLESTVFYNDLNQLIRGSGTGIQFGGGPPREGDDPFNNTGTGRVYGLETLLRYDGTNILALFSATLSRSERINKNGKVRLFNFDQPFLVNALFSWTLPKNRRFGARVRYGAGNPYTPVVGAWYDLDRRSYQAINGERDAGRLRPFFALDIRYDKTYVFNTWKLTAYIDIQNTTNYPNVEVMSYNFDYTKEQPITGLPFFPAFGLKGEW